MNYSDSMSCPWAIEGEHTENPFIFHIMNLLWLLRDRGKYVHFSWIPSHCGIEDNERVDQGGCGCTWQRSLSLETKTKANREIPVLNLSWGSCNHLTSNWPFQGHQVPCLILRTPDCLSPLWPDTDYWPYVPGVWSVTGKSWRILHNWLIDTLFKKILETCIVEFLRKAWFFYLIWTIRRSTHPWIDTIFFNSNYHPNLDNIIKFD